MLVGSPMCTAFCTWQRINNAKKDPALVRQMYEKAMMHIRFVMKLYRIQAQAGRYYLHEHPAYASSWAD